MQQDERIIHNITNIFIKNIPIQNKYQRQENRKSK